MQTKQNPNQTQIQTQTPKQTLEIRTPYNGPYSNPSTELHFEPSIVQQQFKDDSDINNIVATFHRTGVLPPQVSAPIFADVSDGFDFATVQQKILDVNTHFQNLPAELRKELKTPTEFYNAFTTPEGLERLHKLGLIEKRQEAPPAVPGTASASPKGSTEPKANAPKKDES